jgi:hypothetical protein
MTEKDFVAMALEKVSKAVEIAQNGFDTSFGKVSLQVDEESLKKGLEVLDEIKNVLEYFPEQWVYSKTKGKNAVQQLASMKEALDVKLFVNKKIDFKQMKKIMLRIEIGNVAIKGLNIVKTFTND